MTSIEKQEWCPRCNLGLTQAEYDGQFHRKCGWTAFPRVELPEQYHAAIEFVRGLQADMTGARAAAAESVVDVMHQLRDRWLACLSRATPAEQQTTRPRLSAKARALVEAHAEAAAATRARPLADALRFLLEQDAREG